MGGDAIEKPRGVMVLGDCIDDGDMNKSGKNWSAEQFGYFLKEFGLDGTDGFVKYPVFEGWGNHDGPPIGKEKYGFSFQAQLKKRNAIRKQKGLISQRLGQRPALLLGLGRRASRPIEHLPGRQAEPQGPLFARLARPAGLAELHEGGPGEERRPQRPAGGAHGPLRLRYRLVDRRGLEERLRRGQGLQRGPLSLRPQRHGPARLGPAGRNKKWTCINDGQTTAGFFLIQIKGDRLRAAYRTRENVKYTEAPRQQDGADWDGTWGWKWLLDKAFRQRKD